MKGLKMKGKMADKPEIGKFYKIVHVRKGTFYGKVLDSSEDGDWCDVEITSGMADAIMDYNRCYVGYTLSLVNNNLLASFYECTKEKAYQKIEK
jgi:hypothetical protein